MLPEALFPLDIHASNVPHCLAHLLDFPAYLELNIPLSFLGHVSTIFRDPFLLALCSHQNLQLLRSEGVRRTEYIRSGHVFLLERWGRERACYLLTQTGAINVGMIVFFKET